MYHVNTRTFRHRKVFVNSEYEDVVRRSFVQTATRWEFELIAFEMMPSHVHFLIRPTPRMTLAKAMNLLKGRSSRELNSKYPDIRFDLSAHLWNVGYHATRIRSARQCENTLRYIRDQKRRGGLV